MRIEGVTLRQQLSLPRQHALWKAEFQPAILTGAGLLALFIALLAVVQFATPNLAGNDGYYHIKLAQLMRQEGLRPIFNWLPLTILSPESFYDHHFLYHVLLIPFTFTDLRAGAKLAGVVFPALTFLTGWILLRGQRVPFAALWSIGFVAISSAFLYRMSMPRAQSLSLLMLFLVLHVSLTRRYRWLALLGFLYVWLYNAFPLILVVVGIYTAMRWGVDGRLEFSPLIYTTLGVVLGLIINPYFPENLAFIYNHLVPKLTDATATKVGNEWYPYKTWTLIENSGPALVAVVGGIFALGFTTQRMNTSIATLLATCLVFGLMLLKSRRFVEYFPAFALLFCALACAPLLKQWIKSGRHAQWITPAVMMALLLPGIWWSVQNTQQSLQRSKSANLFAGASTWLKENTPEGSLIFQTDWDDFTRLFFYNTHNRYTAGLDPTYMQLHDPDLYDTWVDITKGRTENPAQLIRERFGARYIISDLKHKKFIRRATDDPHLIETYRDDNAVVFMAAPSDDEPLGGVQ